MCGVRPLYERALEQSRLRDGLTRQSEISTSIVGRAVQTAQAAPDPAVVRTASPSRSSRPSTRAATCGPAGCGMEVRLDVGRLTPIR